MSITKVVTDVGRSLARGKNEKGEFYLPSLVLPWYEVKGNPLVDSDDLVIEYQGRKYFIGKVCDYVEEGENGQALSLDKATQNNLLLHLVILGKLNVIETNLLTNIPFDMMRESDNQKNMIRNMFEGIHVFTLYSGDGTGKVITQEHQVTINKVGFASETEIAFYLDPTKNHDVGIIELGSRTLHGVYFHKGRVHYGKSFSRPWGWDTRENKSPLDVSEQIADIMQSKNWSSDTEIRIIGGVAEKLKPGIETKYPECLVVPEPRLANLRAMWNVLNNPSVR